MVRFLTPSKITTLLLIQLYYERMIPGAILPVVLEVIANLILPNRNGRQGEEHDERDPLARMSDPGLKARASVIPGRSIRQLLFERVRAVDCFEKLESFISRSTEMLTRDREVLLKERELGMTTRHDGWIDGKSLLGGYIRKCFLEYVRSQYYDCMTLWTDFLAYQRRMTSLYGDNQVTYQVGSTEMGSTRREGSLELHSSNVPSQSSANRVEDRLPKAGIYDMEKLLDFQIAEMQSFGGRLPLHIRAVLRDLAQRSSSVPKTSHYLQFLDSWRAGNYNGALEHLHQYFDYNMQVHDRSYYQYALLNLAILQADFGCHDEAKVAMEEALSTARENRDTICLSYCLSWLQHFGRTFPRQSTSFDAHGTTSEARESVQFLKHRARETELWSLLSTSCISEAKTALQQGESFATIFEHITQAMHVNTVKDTAASAGPALLMRSTAFLRLGQTHMAYACNHRFLISGSATSPLEDTLKATVRQSSILAAWGRFDDAFSLLFSLGSGMVQVVKYKNYRDLHVRLLQIRRTLNRHDIQDASRRLNEIQHHCLRSSDTDVDTKIAIQLLKVELLVKQKCFTRALEELHSLQHLYPRECEDIALRCRLQIMVCDILRRSGNVHRGFSLAVRALNSAYRTLSMPVLFEAMLAVAQILVASREFSAARTMCNAILPGVRAYQDCDLTGRLYLLYGDACCGMAKQELSTESRGEGDERASTQSTRGDVTSGVADWLAEAVEYLEKARQQFCAIEEIHRQREVLERLGKVHLYRGDNELAIEVGNEWKKLNQQND